MSDKSNFDKGKEYELFAKDIIDKYIDSIKQKNDRIEHNVTLTGLSGATHQIDVLITKDNGERKIIECKNYANNVTKDKIQSFVTVKQDIPNVIEAYFFVKKDYQSGAKLIASKYDINLVQLREYDAEKYKGRITKMKMSMSVERSSVKYIKAYDESGNMISQNRKDFVEDHEGIMIDLYGYASYFASEKRNTKAKNQTFIIECSEKLGKHIETGKYIYKIEMEVDFIMGEPEIFYDYDAKDSVDAELVITSDGKTMVLDKKIGVKEIPPFRK